MTLPNGSQDHPFDSIVVGAGIVGCAVATTFARQGRKVLLLERSLREPDRMTGDLLQPGGVAALRKLGMGACLEGIDAVSVRGFEILWRGESVKFSYPVVGEERPMGRSFRYGRFVGKLREVARGEGGVVVIEGSVKSLVKCPSSGRVLGVRCPISDSNGKQERTFFSHLTTITIGHSSPLRSELTPQTPLSTSKSWGLELTNALLPSQDHAYGILGTGPPILIYRTSPQITRLLIDIPKTLHSSLRNNNTSIKSCILNTIIPTLPPCTQPSAILALKTGRLRSIPNSWLPASRNRIKGLVVVWDALNTRHPLSGGGMTVGLHDVLLLRRLLGPDSVPSFSDGEVIVGKMGVFDGERRGVSLSLDGVAQVLYGVFVGGDPQSRILQRGFIRYLQRGGSCIEEPAGLLGGVIHSPFLLFYHFFAVAMYSLWLYFKEECGGSWWGLGGVLELWGLGV
ncbi:hypothetical protein HYALB_00012263, partial [Hymenoscyphus albidus]